MRVTFIHNSGEPEQTFESEDCSPEYQEYLQMMLESAQAEAQPNLDTVPDWGETTLAMQDSHVWAYYKANNLAPVLNFTYVK